MADKWYDPEVTDTGWNKDMPAMKRRRMMKKAHHGDNLSSGRAMQSLANVTQDGATRKEARADAAYFFRENKQKQPRITPKFRKLS